MQSNLGGRRLWFIAHGLAIVALATSAVTYLFVAVLADDPNRLHAFGCTFILHSGGEVVVRTSADRLVATGVFEAVDPNLIWTACSMYLAAWTASMIAIAIKGRRRRLPSGPRGFPLD